MSTRLFDLCDHGFKPGLSSRIQTPYLSTNPISHYKHGDPNLRVFLKFEIRGSRTQRYLGEIQDYSIHLHQIRLFWTQNVFRSLEKKRAISTKKGGVVM